MTGSEKLENQIAENIDFFNGLKKSKISFQLAAPTVILNVLHDS